MILVYASSAAIATSPAAEQAWAKYVDEVHKNSTAGVQAVCVPKRYPAEGKYRGTALLYHGYSACTQQFDDFAPLLAAQGFDVLVPLIPGMGNNYNSSAPTPSRLQCPFESMCAGYLDDVEGMPTSPQGYVDFTARMNDIMRLTEGERVVAGISVGGTLAAYSGQFKQQDGSGKNIYDRQLIMNPMIEGANKGETTALRALNANPLTRNLWFGWGEGCRHERSLGRGGICTFKVNNAMAAADFGKHNAMDLLHAVNSSVVVIYDQGDPVVSTSAIRKMIKKYVDEQPRTVSSCLLNFTMHSMLSKWDDVGQSKWWMMSWIAT